MNLNCSALKLDEEEVTLGEVMAGSLMGGRLSGLLGNLSDGMACTAMAEAEGMRLLPRTLQEALNEWRVDHDLIAADEMRAWMAFYGLDLEAVSGHLERAINRRDMGRDLPEAREKHAPSREELLAMAPVAAVCSGKIERLSEQFALVTVGPSPEDLGAEGGLELDDEMLQAKREAASIFGVSEDRTEWILKSEAHFRTYRRIYVTDERLADGVRKMREDVLRYNTCTTMVPNEDMARELICCIRVDNDSFERASARAGVSCWTNVWFGTQIGSLPYGTRLPSARPGTIFGPDESGTDFAVAQLVKRIEPTPDEPEVASRVTENLLYRSLQRALSERVFLPPAGPIGFQAT
jgi:hypothetical protein